MLIELTLRNLALIEQAQLTLGTGFHVITGETGAGKSLLLDALALCVGGRTDGGLIRHGSTSAEVVAEFDVRALPLVQAWLTEQAYDDDDGRILLRRQLSQQGNSVRSKAWLNGTPISLNELKTLGSLLVNIHSQHAQHSLLRPQFVLEWLDSAAGLQTQAHAVRQAFGTYEHLKQQAERHAQDDKLRQQQLALLNNQLADVEPLLALDYAALEAEYDELSNLDELMQQAALAVGLLDNDSDTPDAMQALSRAIKICEPQSSVSAVYAECVEQLYHAQSLVEQVAVSLRDYAEGQSLDPERLAQLDEQLATFHRLARKYHTAPNELLTLAQAWQSELDALNAMPTPEALAEQVAAAYDDYLTLANALDAERQAHAPALSRELVTRLQTLALPNVQAEFAFSPTTAQRDGISHVELLFSANVGMPMQPLHKIASGGELSRLALVMQVIEAQRQSHHQGATDDGIGLPAKQLLVFDEVDVGISGGTAQVVGELLRELGQDQQILAITHQAQVAAQAHQHILVYKTQHDQAQSHLEYLTGEAQVQELARMSGGVQITDTTLEHARSLLASRH